MSVKPWDGKLHFDGSVRRELAAAIQKEDDMDLNSYITTPRVIGFVIALAVASYVWFLAWDAQRWLQSEDHHR